ncbi:sensor domain-containing diguanylate cyclase [Piscinibacter sp.]|uniref:sensor domain-containing diguanylate cyclase n=1 Tax=Piscinibacter sp. TaxID=1903157 RepID=UPI002C1815F0|nr:diguanylate cyclase [Albitalea sp.]HUG20903.1 diguanylate cyclase [Albitalea sp.]
MTSAQPLFFGSLRRWFGSVAAAWLLFVCGAALAQSAIHTDPEGPVDLLRQGTLYLANDAEPPADAKALGPWLAQLKRTPRVSLFGGSYWLHAVVHNDSPTTRWVVDAHGSLIEEVQARVYVPGMRPQSFVSGYHAETEHMLHYGGSVVLPEGATAHVLVRLESRYFARYPTVDLVEATSYRGTVIAENVLALCALGALMTLALYNLFMFYGTRDKALLYYSLYLLAATVGWGLTFHIGAQWLDFHDLRWHYVGFFLLPVFNTLFYVEFLQLKRLSPPLTMMSRGVMVLSIALLPSCFIALPFAHALATLVISMSLTLGVVAGIVSLASGFLPARYFLAAFLALVIPATFILPANLGLIESPVRNTELLTLLGGTADAILLAFALADKIRLMAKTKDDYLLQLNRALDQASTDYLTGILNRHAFDRMLGDATAAQRSDDEVHRVMLVMIDLDGLKRINDEHGHTQGDALLCEFARQLGTLKDEQTSVFRLGGDEFAVLGESGREAAVRAAMTEFERCLLATGFKDCGVSYGMAFGSETRSGSQLLIRADGRMYQHKTAKRVTTPAVRAVA